MYLLQKIQLRKIVLFYQYYLDLNLYIGITYSLQRSVKMILIKILRLKILLV